MMDERSHKTKVVANKLKITKKECQKREKYMGQIISTRRKMLGANIPTCKIRSLSSQGGLHRIEKSTNKKLLRNFFTFYHNHNMASKLFFVF